MRTIVFFEPEDLLESSNISFTPHQAVKRPDPVLEAEGDEIDGDGNRRIGLYGTVLRDPDTGAFRMWYTGIHPAYCARYAESDDGIHWSRPSVTDYQWIAASDIEDDMRGTNAIMPGQFPVVIYRPEVEDELDRYFLFQWSGMMNLFRSRDGLAWERHPARWNPVWPLEAGAGLGEVPIPFWDPDRKEFIAMTRIWTGPRQNASERSWDPVRREYVHQGSGLRRMVGRGTSPDGILWMGPDIVYNCDELDPLGSEPYEMAAWPYAGRHVALLCNYHSPRHPDLAIANTLRVYLAWSTDGCHTWRRLHDRLFDFIPPGADGEWDGGMLTQPAGPVEVDDEWWFYYGGSRERHANEPEMFSAIGLATMKKGRLVSISADAPAIAVTRKTTPGFGCLRVNADAREGTLAFEVVGGGDNLPQGISDPVRDDGIALPVTWNGRPWRVDSVAAPVSLRIHVSGSARLWECIWG